jgi:hypothetical protein
MKELKAGTRGPRSSSAPAILQQQVCDGCGDIGVIHGLFDKHSELYGYDTESVFDPATREKGSEYIEVILHPDDFALLCVPELAWGR